MLPPRRQPSFLDFSDVKMVLKIYQKSDVKSSPRGVPPIRAQDLAGVDAAGKEKSAKENFSKPLDLMTSLGRGSPLSLVRRGDDQGGRGYGHIPLTVTATKTVYYDDIGVMQRSCTFWGALGAS